MEHADYQLPNENNRVKYLLDAILCNDASFHADMDMIRNDQGTDGIIGNFETTSSRVLPYDPVAKRKSAGDKRNHENVSDMLSQLQVNALSVVPKPST